MMSPKVLKEVDKRAAEEGCSRSWWLEQAAKEKMEREA
jgi:hypothetical protein